jgi:hypothetical protein
MNETAISTAFESNSTTTTGVSDFNSLNQNAGQQNSDPSLNNSEASTKSNDENSGSIIMLRPVLFKFERMDDLSSSTSTSSSTLVNTSEFEVKNELEKSSSNAEANTEGVKGVTIENSKLNEIQNNKNTMTPAPVLNGVNKQAKVANKKQPGSNPNGKRGRKSNMKISTIQQYSLLNPTTNQSPNMNENNNASGNNNSSLGLNINLATQDLSTINLSSSSSSSSASSSAGGSSSSSAGSSNNNNNNHQQLMNSSNENIINNSGNLSLLNSNNSLNNSSESFLF